MSYINLPNGIPNFKKAVISLWFRVPQASLDAATAEYQAWEGTRPGPLTGIVPLLTFGAPSKAKGFDYLSATIGTIPQTGAFNWVDGVACSIAKWVLVGDIIPEQPFPVSQYRLNDTMHDLDPSYIGVDCTGDYPALSVHIVMPSDNTPDVVGSWSNPIGYENDAIGIPNYGGGGLCPGAPTYDSHGNMEFVTNPPDGFTSTWTVTRTYGGPAVILLTKPEMFRLLPFARIGDNGGSIYYGDAADQAYGGQKVIADQWHHLLLSFDLTNDCATTGTDSLLDGPPPPGTAGERTSSACRMWVAFDDVNLSGKNLSCYWPEGFGDQNALLTVTGYFTAYDNVSTDIGPFTEQRGTRTAESLIWAMPVYNFTPTAIPSDKHPIGLPSISTYVDAIKHAEMAEFQLFTDVTLDTSVEANRRAIIDFKRDAKGNPILDKAGKMTMVPVDPTIGTKDDPRPPAERLLGKRPDVLLHTSQHWIDGKNTGSTGEDNKGNEIPDGQFKPVAGINKYSGPSLTK